MNTNALTFVRLQATENLSMPFYSYIFLIMIISLVFILIRALILWKKNIPIELFVEALRNENSGHFEKALTTYENALKEFKRNRSHSELKNKIIEKLKVLRTIIDYKNKFRFSKQREVAI